MKIVAKIVITHFFVLSLSGATSAQHQTQRVDPGLFNDVLEIGPVEGLTSIWHKAPRETAVPLGATLEFRTEHQGRVDWSGAQIVDIRKGRYVAKYVAQTEGKHVVSVEYLDRDGELVTEQSLLRVLDTSIHPVRVSNVRLSVIPVELDASNLNASTMSYYFRDESIAGMRQMDNGHYLTSSNRWFTLEADVEPSEFSPLLEWRHDGKALEPLEAIRMRVFPPRLHTISAGPIENLQEITLETYLVEIARNRNSENVPEEAPVTFTARTIPPGYESEISWMASTKYGECEPLTGKGPEFTVSFRDTFGAEGRWLGVKADQAIFGEDKKLPPFNIEVTGIEINQGIQNLANAIPVIANRQTIVRVYARETTGRDVSGVRARLMVSGSFGLPDLPGGGGFGFLIESEPITVRADGGSRLDLGDSFNFEVTLNLPQEAQTPGMVSVQAEVNWDHKSEETNEEDNLSAEITRPLHRAAPLKIHFVPVHLHQPAPDAMTEVNPTDPIFEHRFFDGSKDLAIAMTPLRQHPITLADHGLVLSWQGTPVFPIGHDQGVEWNLRHSADRTAINERLAVLKALGNDPAMIYYGMVAPQAAAGGFSGWANKGVAWGVMFPGTSGSSPWRVSGGQTLVHEVGHRRSLAHMRCNGNEAEGGAVDGSYPWPESDMKVCRLATVDSGGYFGLDVYHASLGLADPVVISNDPAVSQPNRGFPMMGYKFPQWVSPYEFCKLMPQYGVPCGLVWQPPDGFTIDALDDNDFYESGGDSSLKDSQELLLVSGILDLENETAVFSPFYRLPQISPVLSGEASKHHRTGSESTNWVLTLEDEDNMVIYRQPLDVEPVGLDEDPPIPEETGDSPIEDNRYRVLNEVLPFSPDVAWIRLRFANRIVQERRVSQSSPVVELIGTTGGEVPDILRWSAQDEDSADLFSTVSYSNDGGATWRPVTLETRSQELAIDEALLSGLPGGDQGRFRVITTDGVNTGFAFSEDFRIPNRPPRAFIVLSPGESVLEGASLRFEAVALDPEDGFLAGDSLNWASDRDGDLGTGSTLRSNDLSVGRHVITLTARDQEGATGEAVVEIEVQGLPQPG